MATPAPFLLSLFSFFSFLSLFISLPTNLYASHAFTLHFPCWVWVSPLWRTLPVSSGCGNCANIACLNPLGGIMAAINHWCSTKTDILLALCWQTAYTSHCSVTLSFVSRSLFLFESVSLVFSLFCVICLCASESPCYSVLIRSSDFEAMGQQGKGHDIWRMLLQKWKYHLILKALLIILHIHKLFSQALNRGTH